MQAVRDILAGAKGGTHDTTAELSSTEPGESCSESAAEGTQPKHDSRKLGRHASEVSTADSSGQDHEAEEDCENWRRGAATPPDLSAGDACRPTTGGDSCGPTKGGDVHAAAAKRACEKVQQLEHADAVAGAATQQAYDAAMGTYLDCKCCILSERVVAGSIQLADNTMTGAEGVAPRARGQRLQQQQQRLDEVRHELVALATRSCAEGRDYFDLADQAQQACQLLELLMASKQATGNESLDSSSDAG